MLQLIVLAFILGIGASLIHRGCRQETDTEAIEKMQSKLDTLYQVSQEKKERLIDTLIIEKTNEKETIKRLQEINNYYDSRETHFDTIPIIISNVKSPFAAEKLREWKLREDTGYYDIPK